MRVFVTGAAGFIGQSVVPELLKHGHQVLGLARSDASAEKITKLGAEVHRGDLEDLESLKSGAKATDGVIHLAFIHDFENVSNYASWCEIDRNAIAAIAEANAGTDKPLITASGTLTLARPDGRISDENSTADPNHPFYVRHKADELLDTLSKEKQIRGSVMRLSPTVHGAGDRAFIRMFIEVARKNGVAAYVGDGASRWPAVHRADAAVAYRLALEKGRAGARYHAVAECVSMKSIMTVIGEKLQVPVKSVSAEEAGKLYGFMSGLLSVDNVTSSEKTREELGWEPTNLGLLADMEANYF